VCAAAARKTTADADSVASQSQDYRGWRWMLPRFKSGRPEFFLKEALRRIPFFFQDQPVKIPIRKVLAKLTNEIAYVIAS
jgi:hypothetical protein